MISGANLLFHNQRSAKLVLISESTMEFPSSSSKMVEDTNVGTDEMVVADGNDTGERTIEPQPSMPLPSMRGKLMSDGNVNICRGVWAMNDAAHELPDQCSDFEFKLVKANDLTAGFPFSGKYIGWFQLKQAPPAKPLKIEDKDMHITFVTNGDGSYQVEGHGGNKFGKFRLRGTLGSDHMIHIYREYQAKPVAAPRKRSLEGGATGPDGTLLPSQKKVAPTRDTTVKRDRKPSLTISDPSAVTVFTRPPSTKHATSGSSSSSSASAMELGSGRTQRPPPHVQKCQDLLKDMTKYPQVMHPIIASYQYISIAITYQHTLSTHPIAITYHHYLSTHPIIATYQHTFVYRASGLTITHDITLILTLIQQQQ